MAAYQSTCGRQRDWRAVGSDTLISIERVRGSNYADTYVATGFNGASPLPGGSIRSMNSRAWGQRHHHRQRQHAHILFNALAAVTVDLAAGTGHRRWRAMRPASASIHSPVLPRCAGRIPATSCSGPTTASRSPRASRAAAETIPSTAAAAINRAIYNNDLATTSGIAVNLAAGTVTGDATVGTDTLRSIEFVRGTNFADTYSATGFSPTSLNAGSNGTFNEFEGVGGNDSITGNGNTRVSYSQALSGVTADIAAGTGFSTAGGDAANVGVDTFTGVNALRGGDFADNLLAPTMCCRRQRPSRVSAAMTYSMAWRLRSCPLRQQYHRPGVDARGSTSILQPARSLVATRPL